MTKKKRTLITTAVKAEHDTLSEVIIDRDGINLLITGVGPIAAAAITADHLASNNYNLVINAGIAGGFEKHAEIGSVVIATEIISADLGVQTNTNGFCSLHELNLGVNRFPIKQGLVTSVVNALKNSQIKVFSGPILTVSTATGTDLTASVHSKNTLGAAAEAMEGFGVATAAHLHHLPVLEIRAISNMVGHRNKELWRINEALHILSATCTVLLREGLM